MGQGKCATALWMRLAVKYVNQWAYQNNVQCYWHTKQWAFAEWFRCFCDVWALFSCLSGLACWLFRLCAAPSTFIFSASIVFPFFVVLSVPVSILDTQISLLNAPVNAAQSHKAWLSVFIASLPVSVNLWAPSVWWFVKIAEYINDLIVFIQD